MSPRQQDRKERIQEKEARNPGRREIAEVLGDISEVTGRLARKLARIASRK